MIGDPLTLEQLRGMDGQPVWVDFTGSNFERPAGWFILRSIENGEAYLVGKTSVYKALEYYGKVWRAYTYPPAHIDREAWRCPICETSNVISYRALENEEARLKGGPFIQGSAAFCPQCGKPRTPEAWAELKKRLRG